MNKRISPFIETTAHATALVTISPTTIEGWRYGGRRAKLRFYASEPLSASGGKSVAAARFRPYREIECQVDENRVITIPAFQLYTMADNPEQSPITWKAVWVSEDGVERELFLDEFSLPPGQGPVITWEQIREHNAKAAIKRSSGGGGIPAKDRVNTLWATALQEPKMTDTVYGIGRLRIPAAVSTDPVVLGANDPLALNRPSAFNVQYYGAKGDGKEVLDAAITTGTQTVTSSTANWTSADVGKIISVRGAGPAGPPQRLLSGTITAVNSATSVTISATASTTVPNTGNPNPVAVWGTDDTTAIRAAVAAARAVYGGLVFFPHGRYLITDKIDLTGGGLTLHGENGATAGTFGFNRTGSSELRLVKESNSIFFIGNWTRGIYMDNLAFHSESLYQTKGIEAFGAPPPTADSSFEHKFTSLSFLNFDRGFSVEGNRTDLQQAETQWQFDDVEVDKCQFTANNYGIYLNTQNADNWHISNSKFGQPAGGYGIYMERVGTVKVQNCVGVGNPNTPGAAMIFISAARSPITIEQTNSEQNTYGIDTANVGSNTMSPITLIGNVNMRMRIRHNMHVVSVGSAYGSGEVFSESPATDVNVTSIGDTCIISNSDSGNCSPYNLIAPGMVNRIAPYDTHFTTGTYIEPSRIDNSRVFGVGLRPSPIANAGAGQSIFEVNVNGDNNGYIVMSRTGSGTFANRKWAWLLGSGGGLALQDLTLALTRFSVDTAGLVTINNKAIIGSGLLVGATSGTPAQMLDVRSGTSIQARMGDSGNFYFDMGRNNSNGWFTLSGNQANLSNFRVTNNDTTNLTDGIIEGQSLQLRATPFASLGTPAAGTIKYCNNCVKNSVPCATGGAGSFAKREGAAWNCD
ncbi:MAG: glycosyl hydrolase family 28-related protein [Pyrinomonadaceae bacterium]